jgi:hypothetical protein
MPPMGWGGQRIPLIVETSRNTEVEREIPEEHMDPYQRESSLQELQKCHSMKKFRYCRIQYRMQIEKKQTKKAELSLGGEQEWHCM